MVGQGHLAQKGSSLDQVVGAKVRLQGILFTSCVGRSLVLRYRAENNRRDDDLGSELHDT